MNRRIVLIIALFVFYGSVCLNAATQSSLESLQTIWTREVDKINSEYGNIAIAWPSSYTRDLAVLRGRMQQSGALDSYVVVNKEYERFSEEKKLSENDIVENIPALRAIQDKYLKISQDMTTEKSEDILRLKGLYFRHLRSLQTELTKQGKIPEAIRIKNEIERVEQSGIVSEAESAMLDNIEEVVAPVLTASSAAAAESVIDQPTTDSQVETWLALRKKSIAAEDAYYASQRTKEDKIRLKNASHEWSEVQHKCYTKLASIKPTDSATLKQVKTDYNKAFQDYQESLSAFRLEAQGHKKTDDGTTKQEFKKANNSLGDQIARLEQALGLDSQRQSNK